MSRMDARLPSLSRDRWAAPRAAIRWLTTPHVALSLVLLAVLAIFVVAPVVNIILDTFQWQTGDTRFDRAAVPGEFTLFHWTRVFDSPLTRRLLVEPLLNSILTALGATVVALVVGAGLAWLLVRTDLPFKRVLAPLAFVPYIMPSYTLALAWLTLFKNERYGAPGMFQYLTGIAIPDWFAYGPVPIMIVLGLHYFPFVYLLAANALLSVDRSLEESGEVLGASPLMVLRRITLPVILPALLSGFVLCFARVIGNFGTPYFLGAPIGFITLPTQIFSNLGMRFFGVAYILVLILITISALAILVNQKLIGVRRSFATITGKGFVAKQTKLGAWKLPLLLVIGVVMLFAAILPFGLFGIQSVMDRLGVYSVEYLTPAFWLSPGELITEGRPGVLVSPPIMRALWNTVRLGITAGLIAAVLGSLIGYATVKGRGTFLGRTLEQVAFLPYLVPSLAFGTLYLALFIGGFGPIPSLYGTFALLVLACAFRNLPFAARTGHAIMLQVSGEMEEAAQTLGAGWFYRMRRIMFPLIAKGMVAGFTFVFVTSVRELSLIITLVTPETMTLTALTLRFEELLLVQFSSAITVLLIVVTLIAVAILNRFGGRFGAQRSPV
jgi:iron(III) transport system permease protein